MSKKASFKEVMDREKLGEFLEGLIKGYKQGEISIPGEEEMIVLKPENMVKVKIEAEPGEDKDKFMLKLSWPKCVAKEKDEKKSEKVKEMTKEEIIVEQPEKKTHAKKKLGDNKKKQKK